jgi:alpha-N-acetylglucosamine transferase
MYVLYTLHYGKFENAAVVDIVMFTNSLQVTRYKLPAHSVMLQNPTIYCKVGDRVFYEGQLKIPTSDMVEYRRVLSLDADVLPVGNLDYLFELSDGDNPILRENLVIAGPFEP